MTFFDSKATTDSSSPTETALEDASLKSGIVLTILLTLRVALFQLSKHPTLTEQPSQ